MKSLLILISAVCLCSSSYAQYDVERDPLVISFKEELLEKSRDGEKQSKSYNLPIYRKANQTVILKINFSGTGAYVTLYKRKDYEANKDNPNKLEILRKRADAKSIPDGQRPMLDLTWLEDGEYIITCQTDIAYPDIHLIITTAP